MTPINYMIQLKGYIPMQDSNIFYYLHDLCKQDRVTVRQLCNVITEQVKTCCQ